MEYDVLYATFCHWFKEQRNILHQVYPPELTKNTHNYKETVQSLIKQQQAEITIGVITTQIKGDGYNDFEKILAPDSEYFQRLKNKVVLDPKYPGFTNETAFTNALNAFIVNTTIDMIAIIRGGGFLSLPVLNDKSIIIDIISTAPKPIILGVGHIGNETLCDEYVSFNFGTPSLAAVGIRDAFLPSIC